MTGGNAHFGLDANFGTSVTGGLVVWLVSWLILVPAWAAGGRADRLSDPPTELRITNKSAIDDYLDVIRGSSGYKIDVTGEWPASGRIEGTHESHDIEDAIRHLLRNAGVYDYVMAHDREMKTIEVILLKSKILSVRNPVMNAATETNDQLLGGISDEELEALKMERLDRVSELSPPSEQLGGLTIAQLDTLKDEQRDPPMDELLLASEQLGGVTLAELEELKRKRPDIDPNAMVASDQLGGVTLAELEELKRESGDTSTQSSLPSEQLGGITLSELEELKARYSNRILGTDEH